MRKIKLALKGQLCLVVFMLLLGPSSIARIPSIAFKNFTKYFKQEYCYYSPIHGLVAIESGLIYNLRFFGNFKAGKDEGRAYWKDTSPHDSTWSLVKLLFPSTGGTLTTQTGGKHQFGNYATPHAVAYLLQYAYNIRQQLQKAKNQIQLDKMLDQFRAKKNDDPIVAKLVDIFKANSEASTPKLIALEKNIKQLRQNLTNITKNIRVSIIAEFDTRQERGRKGKGEIKVKEEKEQGEEKEKEKEHLYPKYTTEQIILAFFCEHFNTQIEIGQLLSVLQDYIPNIFKDINLSNETQEYLWKKDEYKQHIATLLDQDLVQNLDDIYVLLNADLFERLTPYKTSSPPISNGTAYAYDRTTKHLVENLTFQDCVEVTIRHIFNLMLFNPIEQKFDLNHLKEYIAKQEDATLTNNFKNLEQFYDKQSPVWANVGDPITRSAWNAVVGDLNDGTDQDTIIYVHNNGDFQYEITSGFINIIHVWKKAFGLKLQEEKQGEKEEKDENKTVKWKEKEKEDENESEEEKEKEREDDLWNLMRSSSKEEMEKLTNKIIAYLQTMFEICNPDNEYEIRPQGEGLTKELNGKGGFDMYGDLLVTVTNKKNNDLFSFIIHVIPGHSELQNLQVNQVNFSDNVNVEEAYKKAALSLAHFLGTNPHTSLGAWELLLPVEQRSNQQLCLLYSLYPQIIQDNNSIIGVLEFLSTTDISNNNINFGYILVNLLDQLGWNDPLILWRATSVILKLKELMNDLETNEKFQEGIIIRDHVKGLDLSITSTTIDQKLANHYVSFYNKLAYLSLANQEEIKTLPSGGLAHLEVLNLSGTGIVDISGLQQYTSLKKLILGGTRQLHSISLKELNGLNELDLSGSAVKIINLAYCSSLEKLTVSNTDQLQTISLVGLNKLNNLSGLNYLSLKTIYLEQCDSLLGPLYISMENLEEIILKGLNNLKELTIDQPKEVKVIHVEQCDSLEKISIINTFAKSISLAKLKRLEKLVLGPPYKIKIETIDLKRCNSIKEINLSEIPKLKKVSLNGLNSLQELNLDLSSSLQTLHLQDCDSLQILYLAGTNLDEASKAAIQELKLQLQKKDKKLHVME